MNYTLSPTWALLLIALIAWDVIWKGIALWRAARHDQLSWFIALLIVNSIGILPIIYLLIYRRSSSGADRRSSPQIT
jgi:hypothetical protein